MGKIITVLWHWRNRIWNRRIIRTLFPPPPHLIFEAVLKNCFKIFGVFYFKLCAESESLLMSLYATLSNSHISNLHKFSQMYCMLVSTKWDFLTAGFKIKDVTSDTKSAKLDRIDFLLTVVFCYICDIIGQISCLSTPPARIERRNLPIMKVVSFFFNPRLSYSKWEAVFSGAAAQQSSVRKFCFVPPVPLTGAFCIRCGVDTVSWNALSMNQVCVKPDREFEKLTR